MVVVAVKFWTWTKATGLAVAAPPLQDLKPRKLMKALSPARSTVTRPDAVGRVSEKAEDNREGGPEYVWQTLSDKYSDVMLYAEKTL